MWRPIIVVVAALLPSIGVAQTTRTWTGGAGDGILRTATNWTPSTAPANGDTAVWNGTQAGNLTLAVTSGGVGGTNGIIATFSATQTGSVAIVTSSTETQARAFRLTTGTSLSIASGAGAVSFDGAVSTSVGLSLLLGANAATGSQAFTFINNAANTLSIGSLVTINSSTSASNSLTVAGAGNTAIAGVIGSGINGGVTKSGTGTLTLSGSNSFSGGLNVAGGKLQLAGNNVIADTNDVRITNAGFTVGTFSDTAASITSGTGTFAMTVTGGTAGSLATSGNISLAGNDTLALTLTTPTLGRYTLFQYGGTRSGTFASVTGNGVYNVVYGSGSNGTIDLQMKADQAATFTLTPASSRVLAGGSTSLSGQLVNASPAGSASLTWSPAVTGSLTGVASSAGVSIAPGGTSTITATFLAGSTVGAQTWKLVNTDANAITASSTATGTLTVVADRTYSTSTTSLALGMIHQGAAISSPTVIITSTGFNTTTASGTLGSFTGGPTGFALRLTSGSAQFVGGSASQSSTYTLSGTASGLGSLASSFSSAVASEFGSIASVTVAVSGNVYSGQSTWATNGGGNWGTLTGTGASVFGNNWGTNQGSPGLDAGFTNNDTATFGAALTSGTATIALAGAAPSLKGVTFNTGTASYLLAGGTLTMSAGTGTAAISVLAGSHEVASGVWLASTAAIDVATGSVLKLSGSIGGGNLQVNGGGIVQLAGSSGGFTGPTSVSGTGTQLVVNGAVGSNVTIGSGAILAGSGSIGGTLSGGGLVSPGNSPGILTAAALNPTGGLDLAFELTGTGPPAWSNPTASINDVIRLTSSTPFAAPLAAGNIIDVYFNVASVRAYDTFLGGFFTDTSADFTSSIANATFRYFVKTTGTGIVTYNGQSYVPLTSAVLPTFTTVQVSAQKVASADFQSGTVTDGYATRFVVVPEPSTSTALAIAAGGIVLGHWLRTRRTRSSACSPYLL